MPVLYKLAIEGWVGRVRPLSPPDLGRSSPWTPATGKQSWAWPIMNNKLSCTPWTRLVVFNTEFGVVEVQGPMLSRQIHLRVVRGPKFHSFGGKDHWQNMCRSYWQMTLHCLWNLRSLRISCLQFDGNWSVFWHFFKESTISGKSEITTLGICLLHFSSAKPAATSAVPEQGQIAGASCGADAQWGWYFTAMW